MRKNVFSGCKYYVRYAKIVYKQLMARKTVTYESVVKEYLGDKYDPQKFTLTKEEGYRELKKAFPDVCKAIKGSGRRAQHREEWTKPMQGRKRQERL